MYAAYVDALLSATYHPDFTVADRVSKTGGSIASQRELLCDLAFDVHSRGGAGDSGLSVEQLRAFVVGRLGSRLPSAAALEAADDFVEATSVRGGVLEERNGSIAFSHLALQEFLVARNLSERLRSPRSIAEVLLKHLQTKSAWWREPALLTLGYLFSTSPESARELTKLLAGAGPESGFAPSASAGLLSLELAGAACIEWSAGDALKAEVARLLATEVLHASSRGKEPLALRSSAARVLGALGDPRTEVLANPPPTVLVSAGPFQMGHSGKLELVNLPSLQTGSYLIEVGGFEIGAYPVTNAQFSEFVDSGGYSDDGRRYWTEAGWDWRLRHGIGSPAYWSDQRWRLANHPAVGVSWFEAVAFCRFLTSKYERFYMLPNEVQWEKAARGGDSQAWPWGDRFETGRCNTLESELGATTAVGLFSDCASSFGAFDVCGNVWEWCASEFRGYDRYVVGDGREVVEGSQPRIIRGGSWLNRGELARPANRDTYAPDDRHFDLGFRVSCAGSE